MRRAYSGCLPETSLVHSVLGVSRGKDKGRTLLQTIDVCAHWGMGRWGQSKGNLPWRRTPDFISCVLTFLSE